LLGHDEEKLGDEDGKQYRNLFERSLSNMHDHTSRKAYPSDLSDAQWEILEPLLPPPDPEGRPLVYARREIVNALLYVLRTGCAWRQLPHDLPPWQTVYW
jgi:hypothetical protein